MSEISAEGLTKRFGELVAVDGIDLSVDRGEIFGFLGPNGAGKSTTVRMLTTLLKPSSGSARVAGFDVGTSSDDVRRQIGVALQDAALDPVMSGYELLSLQAVLHGIDKKTARARSDELLSKVGLSAAAGRRVGTYSGGMKRRLDLALALMHSPRVLFLDEPTTGLDPNSRLALWEEVRGLNQEMGTTVFLTTQYMEEADRLAQRIAIIDGGKIAAQDTPEALKAAVGDPTLRIEIDPARREAARDVLAGFGEPVPSSDEALALRLVGGARRIAAVSQALDAAGIGIEALELHTPTLDDVFQKITGKRLEGSADD